MAFGLAVYASPSKLPTHDARLASGRWSGATGRAFHPQGSDERFLRRQLHLIPLSQALLGATRKCKDFKTHDLSRSRMQRLATPQRALGIATQPRRADAAECNALQHATLEVDEVVTSGCIQIQQTAACHTGIGRLPAPPGTRRVATDAAVCNRLQQLATSKRCFLPKAMRLMERFGTIWNVCAIASLRPATSVGRSCPGTLDVGPKGKMIAGKMIK